MKELNSCPQPKREHIKKEVDYGGNIGQNSAEETTETGEGKLSYC